MRRRSTTEVMITGLLNFMAPVEAGDHAADPFETPKQPLKQVTYNLELNGLAFQLNSANLEVNTDSRDVALGVRIVRKAEK